MSIEPFSQTAAGLAPAAVALPADLPAGVQALVHWANALSAAASLTEQLIDTPFVPVSFWPLPNGVQIRDFPNPSMKHPRESPEEHALRRRTACAAVSGAMLYGGQLELDPLVALQSIHVVRGRPGLYAEAMVALVKSKGHELFVEELTDSRCVIRARRKGEEDWQRFPFDIARARKAGYVRQNRKYEDDPQSMLYARCASLACRAIAPDVLKGIPASEDLIDEPDPGAPAERTRTVRARQQPAAALPASSAPSGTGQAAPARQQPVQPPASSGPPLPGEDDAPPAGPELITDPQMRKLGVLFGELGVKGEGERMARLTIAATVAGRDLASSKELSKAEATTLIDTLEAVARQDDATRAASLRALLGQEEPPAEPEQEDGDQDDDVDVEDPPEDAGWPDAAQPGGES